jgi:hypothetical protein
MRRCEATTVRGKRCLNLAQPNRTYCVKHDHHLDVKEVVGTFAGMVIGNALLPGLGGLVTGGLTGNVLTNWLREDRMGKKKVFVSFDYDNDKALKDFIIGQSKHPDSPFDVIDTSIKEAQPMKTWEDKARAAIQRSDVVVVMVGPVTYKAPGVLKEVKMARDAAVKIIQVIGYRDGNYTPVPDAGRLYSWSWENLKNLLG